MNAVTEKPSGTDVAGVYQEFETWSVNTGGRTIHAKRMPGAFRKLKTILHYALWAPFFLLPYLRWNGRQAILLDIQNRQFHAFGITVLPQDIWMLSLVLLVAAMGLFAITSVASRVWCGFFCFQTAWTDFFTFVEERIEGNPNARRKLDAAVWTIDKLWRKTLKHSIWIAVSLLTGVSFSIWFVDAYQYWSTLLRLELPLVGWVTLALFLLGTYILAGFLREQTCFWLCPYARIQGVMTDVQTILPAYDLKRGEPRGKLRGGAPAPDRQGDCIDCFQCVQVCPTGVDIREGQQLGCITCGLCIDACDVVMEKINKPKGLIRYMSQDEAEGRPRKTMFQHTRTWVYVAIILVGLGGILWGLTHLGSLTLSVLHERQPLYVVMSDGSIQNKYEFKVLNKTAADFPVKVSIEGGIPGQVLLGLDGDPATNHGRVTSFTVFVRAPAAAIKEEATPLTFRIVHPENPGIIATYDSTFYAPRR